MKTFRLRSDLQRTVIDGFALPLGITPGQIKAPAQGFTLAYAASRDDEPDTYAFHVVVSHERVAPILHRALDLLPEEVYGIVEISSRDAYRTIDVYLGKEPISTEQFLRTWQDCEPILLEDGSIAAGANSEDPFVEVFLDQWKGLSIIVPLAMRDDVESMLQEFDLEEVPQTWQAGEDEGPLDVAQVHPVLDLADESSPDIDDLLLQLRRDWLIELDVDPETNVDDAGRDLGMTLWHALAVADDSAGNADRGAYISIWATAGSLREMEALVQAAVGDEREWSLAEIQSIDRVAYDERPEELVNLPTRRDAAEVHMVQVDAWDDRPRGTGRG